MNNRPRPLLGCWLLLGGLALLICGCTSDANSDEAETTARSGTPENSHQKSTQKKEKLTSLEMSAERSMAKIPATWLEPLDEQDHFFSAPKLSAHLQQSIEATPQHDTVRLLGFVQASPDGPSRQQAIVKIGPRMYFMEAGDVRDGVELLEIDQKSVSLQRGRDRWNLGLLDQPMVNQGIAPPVARVRSPRSSHSDRSSPPTRDTGPSMPELPDNFSNSPSGSNEPDFELPDIPDLPDLPDLPGLGDIPGL